MKRNSWEEPVSRFLGIWLKRKRIPYLIIASSIPLLVMILLWLAHSVVSGLQWKGVNIVIIFAMGLGISIELIGIPYYQTRIKRALLSPQSPEGTPSGELFSFFQARSHQRTPFILLSFLVLVPFVLMDVEQAYLLEGTRFFAVNQSPVSLLVDILNISMELILIYLLAVILWMLITIAWTLNDVKGDYANVKVPIDLLSPDGVGGLGSIHALLRSMLSYYFLLITVLIITYIHPVTTLSYGIIFIIALFIAGIFFFFISFGSISDLIRVQVTQEVKPYNNKIRILEGQLQEVSTEQEGKGSETFSRIQSVLEVFRKERAIIADMYEKNRAFDLRTLAQSAASVIVPALVFLEQLSSGAGAMEKLLALAGL